MPDKTALRYLEELTPGGSEFVGDAERCAEYVREKIERLQDMLKAEIKARQVTK